ncbi:MAG: AAA family ATPase [Desulfovibrio sp.]|uniref:AAA family ATPase n=1 Tax=Desulfovibrio sp. 7SRBS1 TaxID=3378064 RepID=UPI003B4276B3
MATAEQIKSLIRSHFDQDREQFTTIALQVAAHEARKGHSSIAHEIRGLVDKGKFSPVKVLPLHREFSDFILPSSPKERLADIVLNVEMEFRIKRILKEYRQQARLKKYGLSNRRKILLAGPPGTGKTMSATVIAGELNLPLYTVLTDKLVTKFMGETSAKLRQIFDIMRERRGVYLFDEFDAIGAERSRDNDVGEMRRVLNSFLQFLELDDSDSLVIAATNTPKILDQALFRRFDDTMHYSLPSEKEIISLIKNRLGEFMPASLSTKAVANIAKDLSHAEIALACDDAIKEAILADKNRITATQLRAMLEERKEAYGH